MLKTEQQLWNLLSNTPDEQHSDIERPASAELSTGKESRIINAVDGISSLIGTFFRVGVRIALGTWGEKDTKALLASIQFNSDGADIRAINLHQVISEKYSPTALFDFNRRQNEHLPRMVDDKLFLEGKVSALNQTVKLLADKGDTYIMGDTYKVTGQAVVGPHAQARDVVFNQGDSQIGKSVNLSELADELSKLRQVMSQEATETEQYISVGDIAKAEQAAKEKNPSKVIESLKTAGEWALNVATKIGVTLASEAIKQSMGM